MDGHPFDEALAALTRHFQERTCPVVEALVMAQNQDGTLELEVAADLGLGDGLSAVSLALAPGVSAVKVAPGARALLEWIYDGPARPLRPVVRCFLAATYVETTLAATGKVAVQAPAVDVGNTGAAVKLAGGTRPVLRGASVAPLVLGDVPGTTLLSAAPGVPVTGTYSTTSPGTVLA